MNQTRTFLIFAWLMVATLLWMEWGKEKAAPAPTPASSTQPTLPSGGSTVPGSVPIVPAVPVAAAAAVPGVGAASTTSSPVNVTTDVLRLTLDGGELRDADLLRYPRSAERGAPPVQLLATDPANYFVAQSGWVSSSGPAPTHQGGFRVEGNQTDFRLAADAQQLVVPFVWTGANGVTIRRTYTFSRGEYVVQVRDEVTNAGTAPWQGHVYRQLSRVPRALEKSGPMSAESYSFQGAAWYSSTDKYEKSPYDDFVDEAPLNKPSTGGWIAMLQHHFFAAWIPQATDTSTFSLATPMVGGMPQYLIRELGPAISVAPGATAATQARLWIGPKLVDKIDAQQVPGLDRAVDFSSSEIMAAIAGALFKVLSWLHGLFGNWGWAIVGLVVLLKIVMYPLSAAQYKSMAKMRKFQPRVTQLKERYGEDKQKFQLALMELYKKEKINPVGGCLPILLQMPVFLALYWMLSESVELRHAPWIGWITDLTARDMFFVLPAINMAVMWFSQKLNPTTGMDPMQAKMMQLMPLVFGVMFAFMPAGLVLYWVTNGALGLLQQWWMVRLYSEQPEKPALPGK